jgi:acyl-CoA synthetase (NDP forming)
MKLAMTDPNVDAVISMPIAPWSIFRHALETNPEVVSGERFVETKLLEKAAERTLLVSLMGHPDWLENVRRFFGTGAPVMTTPQNAARTLAAMCEYREWRDARRDQIPDDSVS